VSIQQVRSEDEETKLVIGLSHKVKNFGKLKIEVKGEEIIECSVEPNGSKNISSSWILKFKAGASTSYNI